MFRQFGCQFLRYLPSLLLSSRLQYKNILFLIPTPNFSQAQSHKDVSFPFGLPSFQPSPFILISFYIFNNEKSNPKNLIFSYLNCWEESGCIRVACICFRSSSKLSWLIENEKMSKVYLKLEGLSYRQTQPLHSTASCIFQGYQYKNEHGFYPFFEGFQTSKPPSKLGFSLDDDVDLMLPSTNPSPSPTISQSDCLKQPKRCPDYYNRVISPMEGKLKRQELLKVISQMEIIEKLPKQLLQELCRIFKIEEANAPHGLLIQQFKNKMVDIFIQEADGYMDYLQLPKFRSLGPDFTEKMHQLFISVWNEHGEYRQRQQVNITKKEIQEITPSFDSPEKMEQFHLKLLQMYREASICPRNNRQYIKSYQETKISPPQEMNNFLFPNPTIVPLNNNMSAGMQANMYSMFPFSQTPNYPKVEAQEGNPYIVENKPPAQTQSAANLYDIPRFTVQSHPPPQFFSNPPPDLLAILNRTHEKQEELPPKNIFGQPLESTLPSFINYEYVQCVCAGRQAIEDKSFFQCATCGFSYHLICLKIESNPTGGSICPLCILRKETIFCKVTYEPMKFNWHFNQRGKELRVQMTEEESHEIYQARKKGLDCQIRFLKINGKSLKKDKKPLDGYTSCNGYLQKAAKHTEITLPELIEDRHQPISLEIVLRSQDDNSSEQSQPKLYLFAVFLISIKKVDDIVNEIFSSKNFVTRDFYNQFMNTEGKVQVSLRSQNFARGQIKYPVRGEQCHHPEVFDIKNFLQVVSQLKRDNDTQLNCPICSNTCTYFNYDKEILEAIANFPEYDEKKPEGISIQKNGEFYWIGDEEQRNGYDGQIDYEPMEQERDDDDLMS